MKKKINLYEYILGIVLVLIFFRGNNVIEKIIKPLILLVAVLPILINIKNKKYTLRLNFLNVLWLLIGIYFSFSIFYTNDMKSTGLLLIYLIVGVLFLLYDFKIELYEKVLNILFVVCIINAFSIIISAIIPDISEKIYSIWVTSTSEYLNYEKNIGSYSGLSGEKSLAAVTMNISIAIAFSKIIYTDNLEKKQNSRYIAIIIISFVGLLLTGKRMLTAVPVFNLLFIYFIGRDKNKILKVCKIGIPAIILFIVTINFIPKLGNVVGRFLNEGDLGRENLKAVCIEMYEGNKIFGKGFGSFNQYLYETGYRYYGGRWYYHAHNIYYQILAETGIVGITIFLFTISFALYKTVKLYRKIKTNPLIHQLMFISLYIQLLFVLYGITGNTFYYVEQQYLYFFSISIMLTVRKIIKERRKSE